MALFHGLSVGRMSVVATLSAVLTAVIPAIVGLASGNNLGSRRSRYRHGGTGFGLVSWQQKARDRTAARAGLLYGVLAGLGFALLFIALDQAGPARAHGPLCPARPSPRC